MTPLKLLAVLLIPTLAACGDGQSLTKPGDNNNLADRTGNEAKDVAVIPDAEPIADYQVKISQIAAEPCSITGQRDDGLLLTCASNNEHYELVVMVQGDIRRESPPVLTVAVTTEDGTRLINCEDSAGTSEPDANSCLLRLVRGGSLYTGSVQVEGPAVETPTLPDPVKEATGLVDQATQGTVEVKDSIKQTAERIPAAGEIADGVVARAMAASQLKIGQLKDIWTDATNKVSHAAGAAAEWASKAEQATRNALQNFGVKMSDLFRNKAPQAADEVLERMGRSKS